MLARNRIAASIPAVDSSRLFLARMMAHADEVSPVPAESGVSAVPAVPAGADTWAPQVILSVDPLTAAQLDVTPGL
jgi:hypothetical protein